MKALQIFQRISTIIYTEISLLIEAFIDTSYAVALANTKDRHHSLAIELSFLLEGKQLITTECILLEIGNSLARGLRREAIAIISNFLKSNEIEIVHLDDLLLVRAIELYEARDDKRHGALSIASRLL